MLIVSTFFPRAIFIRGLGGRLQFTELIFLFTIPLIPFRALVNYYRSGNRVFISLIGIYVLSEMISSMFSGYASSLLETCAKLYLAGVMMVISYYLGTLTTSQAQKNVVHLFAVAAGIIFIAAVYGYATVASGMRSRLIFEAGDYPYFGSLYRLKGFTTTPTMMISVLSTLVVLLAGFFRRPGMKPLVRVSLALLLICVLLTFSKSILLVLMALAVMTFKFRGWLTRRLLLITVTVFAGVMIFATHIIILPAGENPTASRFAKYYTSGKVVFRVAGRVAYESNYTIIKRMDWRVAVQHLPWGVGAGQINDEWRRIEDNGLIKGTGQAYDPHCTYLGALAENGIFSAIMLVLVFGYLLKNLYLQTDLLVDDFSLAVFLTCLVFVIEAISTDVLNFRHLWLFFAIAMWHLRTKQDRPPITAPSY